MAQKFVLIKSKRSKSWAGAIPVKAGANTKVLKRLLARFTRRGFKTMLATAAQVRALKKGSVKRVVKRRRKR